MAPAAADGSAEGTPTQTARAMKVYPLQCVRGAPPPPHPHVNKVLMRAVKGGQCIELRDLCEGGELFDLLLEMNLEDAAGGDLHLVQGAPAVDAGVDLGAHAVDDDLDGDERTDGAPDVGADER